MPLPKEMDKPQAVPSTSIPPHVVGNCSPKLLQCPNCVDSPPVFWEKLQGAYDWCILLSCHQCNTLWYACNQCADNPWMRCLMSTGHCTQHHKNYHEKKRKSTGPKVVDAESMFDEDNIHSFDLYNESSSTMPCNKFSATVRHLVWINAVIFLPIKNEMAFQASRDSYPTLSLVFQPWQPSYHHRTYLHSCICLTLCTTSHASSAPSLHLL